MAPCPTVKKKDKNAPGGYVVVNLEDFNQEKDEIFEGEEVTPDGSLYDSQTKEQLADILNERDINFDLKMKKAELISLLDEDDKEKAE